MFLEAFQKMLISAFVSKLTVRKTKKKSYAH